MEMQPRVFAEAAKPFVLIKPTVTITPIKINTVLNSNFFNPVPPHVERHPNNLSIKKYQTYFFNNTQHIKKRRPQQKKTT
jgi:hypothetical protein